VAQKADERVTIPAGKVIAGSTPGDRGRDPSLEPALLEIALDEFQIDRLPYPNDPRKRPRTGLTRKRAASLCAARQGRLCTELEWERACKGPGDEPYAGSKRWELSCASKPEICASGFAVLGLGAALREWTASDVEPIAKYRSSKAAAIRGAPASAADVDHRCANRRAVDPATSAADLGFRCCYGKANTATLPSPKWQATVKRIRFAPERLEKMFATIPKLAPLAKDVKYFREEAAIATIRRRGKARGIDGGAPVPPNTYMTTSPILWNPIPGEEVLVVTGQAAGNSSFVVAFHRLPNDRYRVGSAMIMKNERGPVVIVYNPFVRQKLHWAICWECYGETGNISYRDEHRVVITHE